MKKFTCEMCGSTDIVKQDGVFVCQVCGCKYSVEEAKKMMVEGTVEVTGTVKVDNTVSVQKYLENARRAREKEDWEETEKYYNMVEQSDPDNIEAIFYSSYGRAKSSLVDSDIYKRKEAFKVLKNCISIIDEHYQIENAEENKKAIQDMSKDLSAMFQSDFVFTQWKNGYGIVVKTDKAETYELFSQLMLQFRESIFNIANVDNQAYLYEALMLTYTSILNMKGVWSNNFINKVNGYKKEAIKFLWCITITNPQYAKTLQAEKAELEANPLIAAKREQKYLEDELEKTNKEIAQLESSLGVFSVFAEKSKKESVRAQVDELLKKREDLHEAYNANTDIVDTNRIQIERIEKRLKEVEQVITGNIDE